jgi:hypothetical protein
MQMYSLLDLPLWALFTSGIAFAALLWLPLRDVQKVAKACLWLFVYIPGAAFVVTMSLGFAGAPEAIISPFAWVYINGTIGLLAIGVPAAVVAVIAPVVLGVVVGFQRLRSAKSSRGE